MPNILFVTSSPQGWKSHSHRVARAIVDDLKSRDASARVVVRDVAKQPLPHLSADFASARGLPPEKRDEATTRTLAVSDALVGELDAADVIVIAVPMHNFGIPSALKAWIDHIVRPGRTFAYSEKGPRGLVQGKKVVLVLARGGVYSSGPMQAFDFQEPYLRAVLGFIGMTDVDVVRVEGLALGEESLRNALTSAKTKAEEFVARVHAGDPVVAARAAA